MGWIRRHPWWSGVAAVLVLVPMLVFLLGWYAWGPIKTDNVLYNQLIVIMTGKMPEAGPAYAKNVSETVCPLVDEESLSAMFADANIRRRMNFVEFPNVSEFNPIGTKIWSLKMHLKGLTIRTLSISLNSNLQACEAYIYTRST